MNIRIVLIDQINAAAYNPLVDFQPDDLEYEKLRRSIEERTYWAYGRGHQRYKKMVNDQQR
ncbi:hypothetical protein [Paenibacillus sp. PAMC 26794]|uniref:hypothetical protein n=1 Tax=Paenibacillus sp. PAMC 26794 TaxID=1257080 RepID=UPI0002D4E13C|nr:hypothetical protein [Paenibacillus sp. PAMC 26794]